MPDQHERWEEQLEIIREILNFPSVDSEVRQLFEEFESELVLKIFGNSTERTA